MFRVSMVYRWRSTLARTISSIFSTLILILFMCSSAAAQTTSVSATVVDSDGTTWANGTWSIAFQPNSATPDINRYNINGTPLSNSILFQSGSMNSSGVLGVTLYRNASISPAGSTWNISLCPNASYACTVYNFSTASMTSLDLSSILTPLLKVPRFKATIGNYGYADVEAQVSITPGGIYYNVTSACYKVFSGPPGNTWSCLNNATGSYVSTVLGTPQTIVSSLGGPDIVPNIIQYGADPTCSVDSTSAIQTAINSQPTNGGALRIPAVPTNGCYIVSSPLVISGKFDFHLFGDGLDSIIQPTSALLGSPIIKCSACFKPVINDFWIQGVQSTGYSFPITAVSISSDVITVTSSNTLTGNISVGDIVNFPVYPNVMNEVALEGRYIIVTSVSTNSVTGNIDLANYSGSESVNGKSYTLPYAAVELFVPASYTAESTQATIEHLWMGGTAAQPIPTSGPTLTYGLVYDFQGSTGACNSGGSYNCNNDQGVISDNTVYSAGSCFFFRGGNSEWHSLTDNHCGGSDFIEQTASNVSVSGMTGNAKGPGILINTPYSGDAYHYGSTYNRMKCEGCGPLIMTGPASDSIVMNGPIAFYGTNWNSANPISVDYEINSGSGDRSSFIFSGGKITYGLSGAYMTFTGTNSSVVLTGSSFSAQTVSYGGSFRSDSNFWEANKPTFTSTNGAGHDEFCESGDRQPNSPNNIADSCPNMTVGSATSIGGSSGTYGTTNGQVNLFPNPNSDVADMDHNPYVRVAGAPTTGNCSTGWNILHSPTGESAGDTVCNYAGIFRLTRFWNTNYAPPANCYAPIGNAITTSGGVAVFSACDNFPTPSGSTYAVTSQLPLKGTTGTITGTSLSATCDSGTATVTGAVVGKPVSVSSTTGADVGGAFYLRASVTATNTVTVYVCGTGTPASLAYNVVVFNN